jgi:hypothetical protein
MAQSKRYGKRDKHEDDDRELRRLYQKYKSIDKAINNLGWLDLDKPVYLGYIKQFVLRDDISRRKDANVFEGILKSINDFATCKNKDFLRKEWSTKKKVPISHKLKALNKKQFNKLPTNQQKHFSEVYDYKNSCWKYRFIHDYYFVPKIDKHYAYKVRVFDSDLEQQSAEIERHFETNNLWPKINKLMGWSNKGGWDRVYESSAGNKAKARARRDVLGEIDQRVYKVIV